MSQENVEIVRRGFEHFITTGEPLWETIDDEVVSTITTSRTRAITGDMRGLRGGARIGTPRGKTGGGSQRSSSMLVIVLSRSSGSTPEGAVSGVDVESVDGAVWTVRYGKCIRLDYYGSKTAALEAVGLRE